MEIKDRIRQLIAQNKIKEAIQVFQDWAVAEKDSDLQNSLSQIQGRFSQLKKQEMLGMINFPDAMLQQAIITNSILELMKAIEEGQAMTNIPPALRYIALDDYPKGAQVIEVPMAAEAAAKPSLNELPKPIRLLYLAATPKRLGQINTGLESRFNDLIREYDRSDRIEFSQEHGLS